MSIEIPGLDLSMRLVWISRKPAKMDYILLSKIRSKSVNQDHFLTLEQYRWPCRLQMEIRCTLYKNFNGEKIRKSLGIDQSQPCQESKVSNRGKNSLSAVSFHY